MDRSKENQSRFTKYLGDSIYLTASTDSVDEEIFQNLFSFSSNEDEFRNLNEVTLREMIVRIVEDRKNKIRNVKPEVGVIFYCWHDHQSGQFRLNFINKNHSKLPFRAQIICSDLKTVVSDFFGKPNVATVTNSEKRLSVYFDYINAQGESDWSVEEIFTLFKDRVLHQVDKPNLEMEISENGTSICHLYKDAADLRLRLNTKLKSTILELSHGPTTGTIASYIDLWRSKTNGDEFFVDRFFDSIDDGLELMQLRRTRT